MTKEELCKKAKELDEEARLSLRKRDELYVEYAKSLVGRYFKDGSFDIIYVTKTAGSTAICIEVTYEKVEFTGKSSGYIADRWTECTKEEFDKLLATVQERIQNSLKTIEK